MGRLEQLIGAGYQLRVMWECEFRNIVARTPALNTHPLVAVEPSRTSDVLYGGRTEAMRLNYKVSAGEETILRTDIESVSLHL